MRNFSLAVYLTSCTLCLLLGVWIGIRVSKPKDHKKEDAVVVLQSIRDVFKVTTVESEISEFFSQKTYSWIDLSPFRKSVIVRVRAKVSAGFDLDTSSIQIDESSKSILLKFPEEAQILSVDHKLDYYDFSQGTFNSFNAEELSQIQDKARDLIIRTAEQSDLLSRAKARKTEILNSFGKLLSNTGYTIKWVKSEAKPTSFLK